MIIVREVAMAVAAAVRKNGPGAPPVEAYDTCPNALGASNGNQYVTKDKLSSESSVSPHIAIVRSRAALPLRLPAVTDLTAVTGPPTTSATVRRGLLRAERTIFSTRMSDALKSVTKGNMVVPFTDAVVAMEMSDKGVAIGSAANEDDCGEAITFAVVVVAGRLAVTPPDTSVEEPVVVVVGGTTMGDVVRLKRAENE
jgi:hypothetical protein